MTESSAIKRTYDAIALFAMLNMVVLGGFVAFLLGSGRVNGEKLQQIASVLRGEDRAEEGATTPGGTETRLAQTPTAPGPAEGMPDAAVGSEADLEIMRREEDRIKEELRQRLALSNSIMLKVTTERESFQAQREATQRQQQEVAQQRQTVGFEKQIAILESMKPKVAAKHLLGMGSVDEAARALLEMQTRKAKKIVESARGSEELKQMMLILQRVREVAPDRSMEIGAGR